MKLTLTDDAGETVMNWNLEDIGDMREKRNRRILFRELMEEIDHHLRFCPALPEVKQKDAHADLLTLLASLSPEEREEILK